MMRLFRQLSAALAALVLAAASPCAAVYAYVPYEGYNYNYWGQDISEPVPYVPSKTINAAVMGITPLNGARDMFVTDSSIYIADTGNSRIICLDADGRAEFIIESFDNNGRSDSFSRPQGIYVSPDGHIYVADSGNSRIVELDAGGVFIRELGRPETDLIPDTQAYTPTKLLVNSFGSFYVIAYGINMGLLELDSDGGFLGFIGAAEVLVNPADYIWKTYFSTKEQKARMMLNIPTEYSNIFLDHQQFIYATVSSQSGGSKAMLRRLNPSGKDVLRNNTTAEIIGDLHYMQGMSRFTDAASTDYGCCFVLDSIKGRVFIYDHEGSIAAIFGTNGSKEGTSAMPSALGIRNGESQALVLDAMRNEIIVYDITPYGRDLLNAYGLANIGDAAGSFELWQSVLRKNANSELAYVGIGKAYLKQENYEEAMKYFKLGNNRRYYTKAFKFYRKEYMQQHLGGFMTVIVAVAGVYTLYGSYKKLKTKAGEATWNT